MNKFTELGRFSIYLFDDQKAVEKATPCHFVSSLFAIIGSEITSCQRYHFQAFAQNKDLPGNKALVLDREFNYVELLQALSSEDVIFLIRLNQGAHFLDQEGQQVLLSVKKGETRTLLPLSELLSEPQLICRNLCASHERPQCFPWFVCKYSE